VIDPDRANCEFAIVVADAWQAARIGTRLMNALISHLKEKGIKQISGTVLKSNQAMLRFGKQMGFTENSNPDDTSVLSITKHLD